MTSPPDASPTPDTLTAEERRAALDVARRLAELGIPIFVAPPSKTAKIGYKLPLEWQHTAPDPAVVDQWKPGWALCAVMGAGLDLLDVDTRNGGLESFASLNGVCPTVYACASTPSGGFHHFIAGLGVGSLDGAYPGIDIKGGTDYARSRGFAFLSPTEKPSKIDNESHPYRWVTPPDPERLARLLRGELADTTGAMLAERVRGERNRTYAPRQPSEGSGRIWECMNQRAPHSWLVADNVIKIKLNEVTGWDPAGSRGFRKTLMRAAMTLGGYVASDLDLDEQAAREKLRTAVEGYWKAAPDDDDETWITQGLNDGRNRPFSIYTQEQLEAWTENLLQRLKEVNDDRERRREQPIGRDAWLRWWIGEDDELAQLYDHLTNPQVDHVRSLLEFPNPRDGEQIPGAPSERAGLVAPVAPEAPTGGPGDEPPWTIYRYLDNSPFDPADDGSDQGLAEAVAGRMHAALRYGVDTGLWLVRGPEIWSEREVMDAWAIATVARLMPPGQTPIPKEPADRTEEHWRAHRRGVFLSSAGAGRIGQKLRAVVKNVDHPSGIEVAALDAHPEVLWAGGMPWDLRASREAPTLARISPSEPHLHTAACAPAAVETPYWDAFVAAVWPDQDVRDWALRVLSVSLAGYPDAVLPVLFGDSRTGKSSLVALIVKVLGTYGHAADPRLLSSADSHASIIYALKGRRLSFIDEGPRGGKVATERLKQLTGGAQLTGNAMRANPITFEPTHTLVMTSNEEPPLTDPALLARLRVIPCDAEQVPVRAARRALTPAIWAQEAPGVLAKLMAECAAWLADPDSAGSEAAPEHLRRVVSDLEAAQNPIREWQENCTVPTEPGTPGRDLYRAYIAWHDQQPTLRRAPYPSETSFGRVLSKLGFPAKDRRVGSKVHKYRGLSVLGGGGYGPPTTPSGGVTVSSEPTVSDPVAGQPATDAGSPGHPQHSESSRSNPVFSSSVAGVASTNTQITHTHTQRNNMGEIRRIPETSDYPRHEAEKSGSDQAKQAGVAGPAQAATPASTTSDMPDESGVSAGQTEFFKIAEGLPEDFDPLSPITPAQKKLWAAAHGIDERQASGQLKEIKKQAKARERQLGVQAKICELSGPEHALPVALNRALEIHPVEPGELELLLRMCWERAGGQLTVDMENTGYPVGHRHYGLRTVQLGDEELTLVLDPLAQEGVIRWAVSAAPVLVAHSGQADLVALAHAGLGDFEAMMAKLRDTAVLARLADPKTCGSDGGLKEIAPKLLGERAVTARTEADRKALFGAGGWLTDTKIDTDPARSGWARVSRGCATMIRYAGADVLDTAAISRSLPWIPEWLTDRERIVQGMTARITYGGAPLDHEKIRELEAAHTPERDRLAAEIHAFPGIAVENPGSPKQLAAAFAALGMVLPPTKPDRFGRGGGSPSTASAVLTVLRREHPDSAIGELAGLVLGYRHHDTALGTFIGPYKALCELGDARVRPTIYTVGTDTGRTSCVRPNAQQLPRQGGFRAMYGADPGMVIVRADFSGVEIRGAAALSGDATLLESIRVSDELGSGAHADIHWLTAKQAFGPDATKEHRYLVKPGVFTHLYGGRAPTIAEQLGITLGEAELIARSLETLTPTYQAWSRSLIEECRRGRISFDSYSGRKIWISEPRKAPNYAVQGSCREILVDAMLRWRDTRWGGCMILPVHDELLAWVPAEDAHEATAALVECMTTSLTGPSGATVPIKAEPDDPDPETGRWTGSPFWPDAS